MTAVSAHVETCVQTRTHTHTVSAIEQTQFTEYMLALKAAVNYTFLKKIKISNKQLYIPTAITGVGCMVYPPPAYAVK